MMWLEILEQIIYVFFAIGVFIFVIRNSSAWASRQQKEFIEQEKHSIINRPKQFEGKFFFYISKFGIIFASFIILGMVYSILFGAICIGSAIGGTECAGLLN